MSLLGAGMSSSMLCGDSETECLREELTDDALDDDERAFFPQNKFLTASMILLHKHNTNTPEVSYRWKNTNTN